VMQRGEVSAVYVVDEDGRIRCAFCESEIINHHSIYEVIRIYNRKGAFVTAHLCRMERSAVLIGISMPKTETIFKAMNVLIENSNIENGNIEIVINSNQNWSIRFIPHTYPTNEQYRNGVATMLYNALRENPNAKVKRINLRQATADFIEQKGIYEVLYVHNNQLSEGSRSNIFFIKNKQLYTPPISAVLPGITREAVIDIAQAHTISVHETEISTTELPQFDAAFLTGTSPEILPVSSIDNLHFDVNERTMRFLMKQFSQITSE
ncbi:MAG: aminotransferase class IV, partial [Salinivirgaceae bacterium]